MELNARSHGVDLLRGTAILLVLILHFHLTYRLDVLPFDLPWLADAIRAVARNGNYGVTMFFTVSGYLITSTSLRRFGSPRGIRFATFYRFRAARILPCLLLVLAIMVALALLGLRSFVDKPGTVSLPVAVLSVLTFWHNVLMARVGYFNYAMNILWSLSVEEVFYLGFPLVFAWLRRPRYIAWWLLVPIVFAPVYRYWHRDDEIVALYGYWACFDAIAMGCCVALMPGVRMRREWRLVLQGVAIGAMAITYLCGPIMRHVVWGVSVMALGSAVLLVCFRIGQEEGRQAASSWVPRVIRWFGQRSYELYLFHIVVLGVLREYLTRESIGVDAKPLWLVAYAGLAALVAGGVFRWFSEPVNRALRRDGDLPV
ncbi:acyltransferase [Burkholderia plantarii]|uniref:acyltransferase family protein n=1 Tax=Burkholderia plantarii TaxID=41899 RepID=UPI002729DD03|nr:acyltransferase [Burkholderia plantarii]WLE60887.1 acyltransferase [Burkholderia plantarii]